jgi:neurofibromin 1
LDEFSLPKFYQLFGISKVQSAATTAFRSASRTQSERFGGADRGYSMSPPDRERLSLNSLADITEALLEIMEICAPSIPNCTWLQQWTALAKSFAFRQAIHARILKDVFSIFFCSVKSLEFLFKVLGLPLKGILYI